MLPNFLVQQVTRQAWNQLHHSILDSKVGTDVVVYSYGIRSIAGKISLLLIPSENLTWSMWESALSVLMGFYVEGWRELSFNITDDADGGREVGWSLMKSSAYPEVADSRKQALWSSDMTSAITDTST